MWRRVTIAIVALVLVGGCGSGSESKPPQLWALPREFPPGSTVWFSADKPERPYLTIRRSEGGVEYIRVEVSAKSARLEGSTTIVRGLPAVEGRGHMSDGKRILLVSWNEQGVRVEATFGGFEEVNVNQFVADLRIVGREEFEAFKQQRSTR